MPTGSLDGDPGHARCLGAYGLLERGRPPACIVRPRQHRRTWPRSSALRNETRLEHGSDIPPRAGIARAASPIKASTCWFDLSHWKTIDLIDRRNRVVPVVAPGVTYGELAAALAAQGMTVPMPLSPRRGKSVLAARSWTGSRARGQTNNGTAAIPWPARSSSSAAVNDSAPARPAGRGASSSSAGLAAHRSTPAGPSQTIFTRRRTRARKARLGIVSWITLAHRDQAHCSGDLLAGRPTARRPAQIMSIRPAAGCWASNRFIVNAAARQRC